MCYFLILGVESVDYENFQPKEKKITTVADQNQFKF